MRFQIAVLVALGLVVAARAEAEIPGITGPAFTLTATADRITTPDGNSIYFWGFAPAGGRAQYPAPTLIVNQGDTVTVSVSNQLDARFGQRVSIAFSGQADVTASCASGTCVQGPITLEATTGATVTYSFVATRPGTFLYNSASRPDLQVEMGLAGALIVRPAGFDPAHPRAYAEAESAYDQEYLFFLTEMDSAIHDLIEQQGVEAADRSRRLANYFPNYWFLNGRNAPDTMAEAGVGRLPTQPYNCLPRTHPGDHLLMRVIGGGHDMHPYHHHGNHARIIAEDGYELKTVAGGGYDLSYMVFTVQSLPGRTVDAIFRWTGKDIGWDIYGGSSNPNHPANSCDGTYPVDAEGLDTVSKEYCGDHNKPLPVTLPETLSLLNGEFWSGSPFLGTMGLMPPGDGGFSPNAGYAYMWHSHTEKEITNFDIFPGGMMTMLIVEPPHVIIP